MGECSGRCVRVFHNQSQTLRAFWHFFNMERRNLVFAETRVSIGNGGTILESWTGDSHVILFAHLVPGKVTRRLVRNAKMSEFVICSLHKPIAKNRLTLLQTAPGKRRTRGI